MPFEIGPKRQAVIDAEEHVLVLGGPGAGKTTLALLKAKSLLPTLKPGQTILFLSFSRAAVQQIVARCREVLSKEERKLIDVRTYHAFCWELLRAHGQIFNGTPFSMLTPGVEGRSRTRFDGEWGVERRRLLDEENKCCFDLFAHATARMVEESQKFRASIGDLFPLIILDEFQDSDDDQWRLAKALASATQAAFLADGAQRIYDFRPGVRAERLDLLRAALSPVETDLEDDNYRSGGSMILAYANAVLRGIGPLPVTNDVVTRIYRFQNAFNAAVHLAVVHAFSILRQRGVVDPTVAVLAPTNDLVGDISEALRVSRTVRQTVLRPVEHDVGWDAELSATSAVCIAAALEYLSAPSPEHQRALLARVHDYWLVKQDWATQHNGYGLVSARQRATRFQAGLDRLLSGRALGRGACKTLCDAADGIGPLSGDPINDWRVTRALFQSHKDLKEIFAQVRMVRLFRASDAIATVLSTLWFNKLTYVGASVSVRRVLDQERLIGADREPRGCVLMTLHKSKGKEFDGVVIVEGYREAPLLRPAEAPGYEPSRRLLRVGITRARKFVVLVRPQRATPLVGE
jgi:DNA helicase II / ATP-dependent DNA helicase PcrA